MSTWSGDGHFPASCSQITATKRVRESRPSGSGAASPRSGGLSKRRWSKGASVARVARAHGINANQVFGWRRLYLAGRLGEQKPGMKLLPVRVSESLPPVRSMPVRAATSPTLRTQSSRHDSHRTAPGAGAHRRQRRSGVGARVAGVPAGDDRAASEHADLDCSGSDGLAARASPG